MIVIYEVIKMQMKNPKKVYIFILLIILICSIFVNIVQAVDTPVDPGSDGDPVVSKSYVDSNITAQAQQLQLLQDKFNQLQKDLIALKTQTPTPTVSSTSKGYEVVSIDVGQKLLPGIGTEIVMISGKGNSLKGQNGGLIDTTAAKQIVTVTSILLNHVLISPANDGRGIIATAKSSILVRGSYKIAEKTNDDPVTTVTDTTEKFIGSGTINATSLNVREKADVNSNIVTKLTKGQTVMLVTFEGDWYKIKTTQGQYGWALGKYINLKN
jgi:hypothetical protein